MSLDDHISGALLRLREYAGKEKDGRKLVELLREINSLLNVIEKRVARLERDSASN